MHVPDELDAPPPDRWRALKQVLAVMAVLGCLGAVTLAALGFFVAWECSNVHID